MNKRGDNELVLVAYVLLAILLFIGISYALPFGASVDAGIAESKPGNPAGSVAAQAGNVTEVNITGESVTQSWQGYYGEISGTITLDNANNYTLYNWTIVEVEGEVYAANETVTWTNIQCFNFTANGSISLDESSTAGGTSLTGMNLSQLEGIYGINTTDPDGVNETFIYIGASTHDQFYTGSLQFTEGECQSTRVFSEGAGQSNRFEEVLLYDPDNDIPIFAAILENDLIGFDSQNHDFEMIVLEDGHDGDTDSDVYYFYLELG